MLPCGKISCFHINNSYLLCYCLSILAFIVLVYLSFYNYPFLFLPLVNDFETFLLEISSMGYNKVIFLIILSCYKVITSISKMFNTIITEMCKALEQYQTQ